MHPRIVSAEWYMWHGSLGGIFADTVESVNRKPLAAPFPGCFVPRRVRCLPVKGLEQKYRYQRIFNMQFGCIGFEKKKGI